ncbi:MAG: hypothetical protein FJ109_04140 [Deltaproteobacteria bacterium]|nr:hypothetical protein [Deltaproteobacteria bacterium]
MLIRLAPLLVILVTLLPRPVSAQTARETDVVIVSSRANQLVHEQAWRDYRKGIRVWGDICTRAGLSFRIAGDYELEAEPGKALVYILHHMEHLSQGQLANLERLRSQGIGLVLIGNTGGTDIEGKPLLDGEGKPIRSLAERLFELSEPRDFTPEQGAYFVSRAGNPFSLGNDPGFRFEFDTAWPGEAAASPYGIAFGVNWDLQPFPDPDRNKDTVLALREMDSSRIVWMGVGPDSVLEEERLREAILDSSAHLLRWVARRPVAALCHWQGCAQSAAVVTADVEDKFETGEAIALTCRKEGVRGSFFLVGLLAPGFPEVVTALAQNGEIGTHSIKHESFEGRPYEDQLAEMSEAKINLQRMGVEQILGFRPPMEQFDEATVRAVASADLKFIFGNLQYDRAYPVEVHVNGTDVWQFARIAADDYNLVVERGVTDVMRFREEYMKEFDRLHEMGGMFPFAFHTNYLALEDSIDAMRTMIKALRTDSVWLTTFGEIVRWVQERQSVTVTVSQEVGTTLVTVTNSGKTDLKKVPVHLFPPASGKDLKPVATPERGLKVRSAERGGFVLLVDMPAGQTRVVKVQ